MDRAFLVHERDDADISGEVLLGARKGEDVVRALVRRDVESLLTNGPVPHLANRGYRTDVVLLVLGSMIGHVSDVGVEPVAPAPVDVVVMMDAGLGDRDVELDLFFLLDDPDPVIGALGDERPHQRRVLHGHDLGLATTLGVEEQLHPYLLLRGPPYRGSHLVFFTYEVHRNTFTSEVKISGDHVEISFADAQMAALCNSKQLLTARWGSEGFLLVGRHLEALAAIDCTDVEDLSAAVVELGASEAVTIVFDRGRLTITAVPTKGTETTDEFDDADGIRIVSLTVEDLT